jgi:hypothetical protein
MKSKSGGGITSRNVVNKPVRTGQPAKGINPAYASQIGRSLGDHSDNPSRTSNYRGDPRIAAVPVSNNVPLGNAVAAKTVCGPGGSRSVMPSGNQGQHGPANPGSPPPKGELFPGWPAKSRS